MLDENVIWCLMLNWIHDKFKFKEEFIYTPKIRKIDVKKVVLMDAGHNYQKVCY